MTSIELTPQFSVEPKVAPLEHDAGVDVGAFHMSWREVREMRQAETVDKSIFFAFHIAGTANLCLKWQEEKAMPKQKFPSIHWSLEMEV